MNNFSPVATEYAVELHTRIERGLRAGYRTFALTSAEVQKRKDHLDLLHQFSRDMRQARLSNYPKGAFTKVIETILPVWVEEVDHNQVHSFSRWLPASRSYDIWRPKVNDYYGVSFTVSALDLFLEDCYGVTEAEFERRVARVEEALSYRLVTAMFDGPEEYIKPGVSAATFDIKEFCSLNTRNKKIAHYAKYLEEGHNINHIHKLNHRAPFICGPGFLEQYVNLYGTPTLNQMFSLRKETRQILTEQHVADLLNVGYRTAKEVHQYAKAFNISANSQRYFDRVIEVKRDNPNFLDN